MTRVKKWLLRWVLVVQERLDLISGIGSCWFDSVPCLFITGQVNTYELKGDRAISQQGFQEFDIIPMVDSITKYEHQVTDQNMLLGALHHAI